MPANDRKKIHYRFTKCKDSVTRVMVLLDEIHDLGKESSISVWKNVPILQGVLLAVDQALDLAIEEFSLE